VDTATHSRDRVRVVDEAAPGTGALVDRLLDLAERGLPAAHLVDSGELAQTVRGVAGGDGVHLQREGTNLRYAGMAALGLARLPLERQRRALAGSTAADLVERAVRRAETHADPGAVAMTAWAAAEVCGTYATPLLERLGELLRSVLRDGAALPTVDTSWIVAAAVAAHELGDTAELIDRGTALLRTHEGPGATYPHVLPPHRQPAWRAHVGSFADQVYPLQALARASVITGDVAMLHAAERTAQRLVDLQGSAGQWWWHYDVRDGSVVERYPVYSVHQHAMGPMVLMDLAEAGGTDHRAAVAAGLHWLERHPEVVEDLVHDRFGVVWRKVGRREPPKAARALAAATTAVRRGARVPGLDRLAPPVVVDHECRPYELGWLLHAWLPVGGDTATHIPRHLETTP